MAISRHHLTILEKNQLRAHHRERPDLTQEQLREWIHGNFGKWIGRSTIGKLVSTPDEVCANPLAKRVQSGRYPEMEAELFNYIMTMQSEEPGDEPLRDDHSICSEGPLWIKANEILKRTKGSNQSVSLGWVQRFKKRHGLHRSQRIVKKHRTMENALKDDGASDPILNTALEPKYEDASLFNCTPEDRRNEDEAIHDNVAMIPLAPKSGTMGPNVKRKHFVAANDILLLSHVLDTKPWTFANFMDGWQQVCDQLRQHVDFNLDKTAGACQARVVLLLDHLRAGNVMALQKSGTMDEYERKHDLLLQVQAMVDAHNESQEQFRNQSGSFLRSSHITQHEAAVVKVGEVAAAIAATEAAGEVERDGQRRLDLLEIKMERELAEQRRYADEQVRQLERLQRAQLEAQQNQHAQLLAAIQQQQIMMLDLMKSVATNLKKD